MCLKQRYFSLALALAFALDFAFALALTVCSHINNFILS